MESNRPNFNPYEGEGESPHIIVKPYIFVSYSRNDGDVVINDLNELDKMGYRIWYDYGLGPGEWEESIRQHIKDSKVFLIFVSDNSLNSKYIKIEYKFARDYNLPIIPIFIKNNLKSESWDHERLKELQGIVRFKYESNGDIKLDYYWESERLLEKASKEVRDDARGRDSKRLGLCYLPTIKDIFEKHNLTQAECELRRKQYVHDMADNLPAYNIENIFQLTSDKTNARQNLEEIRFESITEKPSNLVSLPLDIEETYIAPLRLISGLITRLDENWPPLVKSYGKLVKQGHTGLLDDLHYFIEFCWLAWGPSVLTMSDSSDSSTEKFVVFQAAYGDEANSLPLIMKQTLRQSIKDRYSESQYSYSGYPVSLKNVLLVRPGIDKFFSELRDYPLFKDMFSGEDTVALYLPDVNDGYASGDIKLLDENVAQNGSNAPGSFYSTAYVWLMLEQVDKTEVQRRSVVKNNKLEPGKVLPFFEHANLATKKGLNFLQHCLARKAIYHVLECEADKDYQVDGYYRFATALFPEQMLAILDEEIRRLDKDQQKILENRLIIPADPKHWRTSLEVVEFADAINKAIKDSLTKK